MLSFMVCGYRFFGLWWVKLGGNAAGRGHTLAEAVADAKRGLS